jgi:hypothetical protein
MSTTELVLDESQYESSPFLCLSLEEIQHRLDLITLQLDALNYLEQEGRHNHPSDSANSALRSSMFCGNDEQEKVACSLLVVGENIGRGFEICFKMVKV